MELRYVLADVFTDQKFGGNQLAVFPEAAGFSAEQMQAIAGELNLSETTFVTPPTEPGITRNVRIFTPRMELPFAGHPTIGTAAVLLRRGFLRHDDVMSPTHDGGVDIILAMLAGPVPVRVHIYPECPSARLSSPKVPVSVGAPPSTMILASLLSLDPSAIDTSICAPACMAAGVPFTFVPVRDRTALGQVKLNAQVWEEHLRHSVAPHIYAFTLDDWRAGRTVYGRMFAPAMGITEDPATGGAVAALAGLLLSVQSVASGTAEWTIHQGIEMGRPSRIALQVDVQGGAAAAVHVGGATVIVGEGALFL